MTTIIAELGINCNGDVDIAKKLILGAKYAGADLVKLQKRTVEAVYTAEELEKSRENPFGKTNGDLKRHLEFDENDYDEIDHFCKHEAHIPWFASPWDLRSIDFIQKYKPEYWKIPAALLVHIELLEKVASLQKKTFISCGMSTWEEIDKAVEIFEKAQCTYELMHCLSTYPANDKDLNLNLIPVFQKRYLSENSFCQGIGYSGHEVGLPPSVAAVALGATSIERHITLDRAMWGSDQAASVEINGFRILVDYIRLVEKSLGDGIKNVTPEEEKCKSKLRRTCDY